MGGASPPKKMISSLVERGHMDIPEKGGGGGKKGKVRKGEKN